MAKKPTTKPTKAKPATKATKATAAKDAKKTLYDAARLAVLKAVAKRAMSRTELKAVAPFGNYTLLMRRMSEEGVVQEVSYEDTAGRLVEITTKGKHAIA